jgi:peptide/nickel transport system substrate-binding protein
MLGSGSTTAGPADRAGDGAQTGISRRSLLKISAGTAAAVAAPAFLSACGGSGASVSAGKTKRGGTLKVGVTSGGSDDTIDPSIWTTNADGVRIYQLFNSLLAFNADAQPVYALAEEVTPNSTATEWTIRLRSGVEWHDGKPLTADDVLFTFGRIVNPKQPLEGAPNLAALDLASATKLDALTLRIPCKTPFSAFKEVLPCYQYMIVPVGFDPRRPIGTGPFKFESFTPGVQSTFVRNGNYWQTGLPYVNNLVISDVSDESTQVDGLLSGTYDAIDALSYASVAAVKGGGGQIVVSEGGSYTPFTMRVDQYPFNDRRVVQAFRLAIDRPAMMRTIFGPYGILGNDVFGIFDVDYDHSMPQRNADIDQAKFLLKQAGRENLTVTLTTSDIAAGAVSAATIFAEQAKAAGITVQLSQVPVTTLYGPNYEKWLFAQDIWTYYPYQPNASEVAVPGAPFNECHVSDPVYDRLFTELSSTLDPALRAELTHELMLRDYNGYSSGYMIPHFVPAIDGYSSRAHGMATSKTSVPFGCFNLQSIWLD